ncbi:MAG: hypothetical protein ACEQSX_15530 [Baekduiaceae bacterium]
MAASDSTVVFSGIDDSIVLSDGTGTPQTLTMFGVTGNLTFTLPLETVAEMRIRDLHHSTVTVRKTGDGNVTGSIKAHVSSYKGSSTKTLYEVMTGNASWLTVGAGDGRLMKMVCTYNATGAGGASQTMTFAYVRWSNVNISYDNGLLSLSADFTDFENQPVAA